MSLEGWGDQSPDIRASDGERSQVVELLRAHCSEGRIDLDEFSERVSKVYEARTLGELNEITADLPVPMTGSAVAAEGKKTTRTRRAIRWTIGIMSGPSRKGRWRIEGSTNAFAFWGGVMLDLRDAEFEGDEIVINATAIMGGIEIIVPEGMPVDVGGFQLMGGIDDKTADVPVIHGMPIVRVKGFALMGGIDVKSKASPEEERRRKDDRRRARDQRRQAFHERHAARHQSKAEMHAAIERAKREAIEQAREATKRALASIPDWLPTPPPPVEAPAATPSSPPAPEGTVTLLVTDICGSTVMAEAMGDIRWVRLLKQHDEQVRTCLRAHGGTELKHQGDGFLLAFPSARKALLCAVQLQKTFAEMELPVRMGLHTGEVIRDGDDLYGRNVILATRIADVASSGEILLSSLTKELTDSSGDLGFAGDREVELKGLNGSFRVWSLAWQ